ncbi:uncharacterized protein LOC124165979 isoform X3 [Ischnura elegans]|uniref:uncharacterized protein LOC124165979 isoform X3 n=1 Tax=Ischnura elegans TaxID=197161 RepID=UPI001ED88918|nr:uncharacterized protein LOC124165979 isoform X3 [Ischnura elegans]
MMANEYEDIPLTKPLRLIEMVFCAVLFGLLIHICSAIALMSYLSTMYVTFGGFLLITATDVISQLAADPIPDTPMFLLSLAGCALFLTTGGLSLDTLFDHTSKIAEDGAKIKMLDMELIFMAALSILNGVIFLVDAALIFRRKCSVKPSDQTMVEKLSKRPTSAEVEDRLMGTEEIRGGGVYIRARRGGASGEQAPTLYERYTSEQSYIPPIPGTPRISVTYGGNVRMAEETLNSQRTSKLGSHSHRSQERSMRTSPASSFMFDDMDYLSTPRRSTQEQQKQAEVLSQPHLAKGQNRLVPPQSSRERAGHRVPLHLRPRGLAGEVDVARRDCHHPQRPRDGRGAGDCPDGKHARQEPSAQDPVSPCRNHGSSVLLHDSGDSLLFRR